MRTILAIDDQQDNITTIKAVIKSHIPNCRVLIAQSGKEGIELAQQKQPDTILLDIIMPQMDGYETCKRLKENELTKHIPVVMITAIKTDSESRAKGLNMGADAFLSKPIDPVEISAQVNVMLRIKKAEDKLRVEKNSLKETVSEKIDELKESEDKFRMMVLNSSDLTLIQNSDGELTYISPQAYEVIGHKGDKFLKKKLPEFIHPDDKKKVIGVMQEALKGKDIQDFEYRFIGEKRQIIWLSHTARAIKNNGKIAAIQSTIRNITKQKLAEGALKISEERLKIIFESAPDAIYLNDLKGNFLDGNKAAENMLGYKKEELIGKSMFKLKLLSVNELAVASKVFAQSVLRKSTGPDEFILNHKNGSHIPVEISTYPTNIEGKTVILGIARDISERKKAEEELKENEQFLNNVFESVQDGISVLNPDLTVRHVNEVMNKWNAENLPLEGKKCYEVYHNADKPCDPCPVLRSFKSGKTESNIVKKPPGSSVEWIELFSYPMIDPDSKKITGIVEFVRDITKNKHAEDKLQESEEKFRLMTTNTLDTIWTTDLEVKMTFVNNAIFNFLGYTQEEFMGLDPAFFTPPEGMKIIQNEAEQLVAKYQEGEMGQARFEIQQIKKDGTLIDVEVRSNPLINNEGQLIGFQGRSIDISERKRSELIQKLLYNISNAIITTDNLKTLIGTIRKQLGTIIDTTNFYVALYDKYSDTISLPFFADIKDNYTSFPAGKTFTKYVIETKKSLIANKKKIKQLIEEGHVEIFGASSKIWLGVPLIIDGEVTGVLAVQSYNDESAFNESDLEMLEFIADQISISIHRKKTEEELQKSETLLRIFLDSLDDAMHLIDSDFRIRLYNRKVQQWCELLGFETELIGKNIQDVFPFITDVDINNYLRVLDTGESNITQEKKELGDQIITTETRRIPLKTGKKVTGVVTIVVDISQRKKAEKDLKAALEKATESDRLKSAFLANMSHEIRTPMNGILGFSNLLKEPELGRDKQKEYVDIIEKSGERMLSLINNLVDISKIEARQMDVYITSTNINKEIEDLYNFFKPEVENKGMQLYHNSTLEDKDATIETDKEKLYAILANLIKNAIKYSDKGRIEIGYNLTSSATDTSASSATDTSASSATDTSKDSANLIQFYVKDTGIGIPKDRQKAIFDRFVQADIEDLQVREGSGLGLSITKAYVEMLGGKIWLKSQKGKGSQFYFTIPYKNKPLATTITIASDNKQKTKDKLNNLRILIVEDDETADIFLIEILKEMSSNFLHARTGTEGIEISKNNDDIDLILMDIKMPDINGYEATKKIREFNKDVAIIAQTAYALSGDRKKAIQAGCDDYISKPINSEELKKKIIGLLSGGGRKGH